MARELKPDIVLLDVVMPGSSGIDAAAEIRIESPDSRILMLSMQDDPTYVRQAFASGAAGYVLKDAADAELVEAVRKVAGGDQYVHPTLGARLVAEPGGELGARRLALGPRAGGPEAARPGPHEPGDRAAALRQRADGRGAPGAHPEQAPGLDPGRARAPCDRHGPPERLAPPAGS